MDGLLKQIVSKSRRVLHEHARELGQDQDEEPTLPGSEVKKGSQHTSPSFFAAGADEPPRALMSGWMRLCAEAGAGGPAFTAQRRNRIDLEEEVRVAKLGKFCCMSLRVDKIWLISVAIWESCQNFLSVRLPNLSVC